MNNLEYTFLMVDESQKESICALCFNSYHKDNPGQLKCQACIEHYIKKNRELDDRIDKLNDRIRTGFKKDSVTSNSRGFINGFMLGEIIGGMFNG